MPILRQGERFVVIRRENDTTRFDMGSYFDYCQQIIDLTNRISATIPTNHEQRKYYSDSVAKLGGLLDSTQGIAVKMIEDGIDVCLPSVSYFAWRCDFVASQILGTQDRKKAETDLLRDYSKTLRDACTTNETTYSKTKTRA